MGQTGEAGARCAPARIGRGALEARLTKESTELRSGGWPVSNPAIELWRVQSSARKSSMNVRAAGESSRVLR